MNSVFTVLMFSSKAKATLRNTRDTIINDLKKVCYTTQQFDLVLTEPILSHQIAGVILV